MRLALHETIKQPVNPDTFLEMLEVWLSARDKPLRPEGSKRPANGGLMLTDIPINRSGLAVTAALRERKINPEKEGYLLRLMHLSEIVGDRDKFASFIRTTEDGQLQISEALLRAAALARFELTEKQVGFDLDDVLTHADRLQAVEDWA